MRDILRLVLVLAIICIVAAAALAKVYDITKGPIAYQKKLAVLKAITTVLPEYDNKPDEETKEFTIGKDKKGEEIKMIFYQGKKSGELVGIAFKVVAHEGYGGDIEIMMGVDPNGIVTGVEILGHNETPGLGAKITEDSFKVKFKGLSIKNDLRVKKDGGEVDQITGATISPRAVVEVIKEGLELYQKAFPTAEKS